MPTKPGDNAPGTPHNYETGSNLINSREAL